MTVRMLIIFLLICLKTLFFSLACPIFCFHLLSFSIKYDWDSQMQNNSRSHFLVS
uniref:Uncharacterized protein n=1 Tax=Rhizophora mucronata TaxID=61149 RepID=A0A2P2ITI6_RHIMU